MRKKMPKELRKAADILLELSSSLALSSGHVSRCSEASTNTEVTFFTLENKIVMLRRENQVLKHRVLEIQEEMAAVEWGMKKITGNDHKVKFYMGLPNYKVLVALLAYLK